MNKKVVIGTLLILSITMCMCPSTPREDKMNTITFVLTDRCDDGEAPTITYYDITNRYDTWGPYYLQALNEPLRVTLDCVEGHTICYGAWVDAGYWGCGRDCERECKKCCGVCTGKVYESVGLVCSDRWEKK